MNTRKNQNSILVLATLGVYLGLVLAGATPQVLAQAAMTRQFDVKDEIEVKEDLDKKPDSPLPTIAESPASEIDNEGIRSFEQFFAKFQSFDPLDSLSHSHELKSAGRRTLLHSNQPSQTYSLIAQPLPLDQILTVTNFPRAGLDTLLASDAK